MKLFKCFGSLLRYSKGNNAFFKRFVKFYECFAGFRAGEESTLMLTRLDEDANKYSGTRKVSMRPAVLNDSKHPKKLAIFRITGDGPGDSEYPK